MREVAFRLRMMQPCLAGIKNSKATDAQPFVPGQPVAGLVVAEQHEEPHFIFNKDAQGHALMMQDCWTRLLVFACKSLSISIQHAHAVWMAPAVTAKIETYRRYYDYHNPSLYKVHEALLVGAEPEFRAVIEPMVTAETLTKILSMGGRYAGLTVFGWKQYGRFEVVSCG